MQNFWVALQLDELGYTLPQDYFKFVHGFLREGGIDLMNAFLWTTRMYVNLTQ
jgi:hypothetical protein